MKNLEFNSVHRYFSCGNEIQICETNYKGVHITERTIFHYNIFKSSVCWYILDLVLPVSDYNYLSEDYYTAEGYGMPEFNDIEQAIQFIDKYKHKTC